MDPLLIAAALVAAWYYWPLREESSTERFLPPPLPRPFPTERPTASDGNEALHA